MKYLAYVLILLFLLPANAESKKDIKPKKNTYVITDSKGYFKGRVTNGIIYNEKGYFMGRVR